VFARQFEQFRLSSSSTLSLLHSDLSTLFEKSRHFQFEYQQVLRHTTIQECSTTTPNHAATSIHQAQLQGGTQSGKEGSRRKVDAMSILFYDVAMNE